MKPGDTIYAGDAQFAGWSDSHTQGPIIKIRLPSSDDLDKFRALTAAKGKQAGHLFTVAIVETGEEGEPVPPPDGTKATDPMANPHPSKPAKPGPLCIEAADYCRNPNFQRWAQQEEGVDATEAGAKEFILHTCSVDSRKDIDSDPDAAAAFVNLVRIPFMHWERELREGSRGEGGGDAWDEGAVG